MFAQATATEVRPRNPQRSRVGVAQAVESGLATKDGRETEIMARAYGANESGDPCRITQKVVAALNAGRFEEALDLFDNGFKFTDHALGLEFEEKERLIEFFQKLRVLFPGAVLATSAVSECEDKVIIAWTLRATQTELFMGGLTRHVRISSRGVSIVKVENERICQWSDYYDEFTSHRTGLASLFRESSGIKRFGHRAWLR